MPAPLTKDAAVKLTIATLMAGCLSLASAVWWLRDEMDRRTEVFAVRIEKRLDERLSGYVTREQRYEDREALHTRLTAIAETVRRR